MAQSVDPEFKSQYGIKNKQTKNPELPPKRGLQNDSSPCPTANEVKISTRLGLLGISLWIWNMSSPVHPVTPLGG
jgi:hypothetical protein